MGIEGLTSESVIRVIGKDEDGGKIMVKAKGTFQQSKRQHEDNDAITHIGKDFPSQ